MNTGTAAILFVVYAAGMGVSLGGIFLVFTGASIARVFFITAATYGGDEPLRLHDPSRPFEIRGVLFMGLIGIVVASRVNVFVRSDGFQFVISIVGVIVFIDLTGHDTQRIKEMYFESDGEEIADKKAIIGALALYLDFINLFLLLFGQRRQD